MKFPQDVTVTVSADADAISKVETAMSNANKYYSDLLGYAISFDKQQMNKEALQQSITGMKNDAATVKTNLQGLNASDNKVIGALIAYYQTVESALAKAQNDMSEAALSSQIKEIYLEIGAAKVELVQNLQK